VTRSKRHHQANHKRNDRRPERDGDRHPHPAQKKWQVFDDGRSEIFADRRDGGSCLGQTGSLATSKRPDAISAWPSGIEYSAQRANDMSLRQVTAGLVVARREQRQILLRRVDADLADRLMFLSYIAFQRPSVFILASSEFTNAVRSGLPFLMPTPKAPSLNCGPYHLVLVGRRCDEPVEESRRRWSRRLAILQRPRSIPNAFKEAGACRPVPVHQLLFAGDSCAVATVFAGKIRTGLDRLPFGTSRRWPAKIVNVRHVDLLLRSSVMVMG